MRITTLIEDLTTEINSIFERLALSTKEGKITWQPKGGNNLIKPCSSDRSKSFETQSNGLGVVLDYETVFCGGAQVGFQGRLIIVSNGQIVFNHQFGVEAMSSWSLIRIINEIVEQGLSPAQVSTAARLRGQLEGL